MISFSSVTAPLIVGAKEFPQKMGDGLSKIFFSFVMPAYKGRYLKESIESILAQDYHFFELIIVDDSSPDNLFDIVSQYNDTRISFYRNEKNLGGTDLVAQWNHCLSYAKGEYVILATDDDLYEPNFLSSFVPLIEKYPEVALFRARILQVDGNNHIKQIDSCYKEFLKPIEFWYHFMHGMKGGIPHYIFKRDILEDKGGFVNFPMAWASDDATALMMSEFGVVTSMEHLVRFRWSDINISSNAELVREKVQARIIFSQWLQNHIIRPTGGGEWEAFFQNNVIDYLRIYQKITLIKTMKKMKFSQWLDCVKILLRCDSFTTKDKFSIIYRTIKR